RVIASAARVFSNTSEASSALASLAVLCCCCSCCFCSFGFFALAVALSISAAEIAPATEEPAMTASSPDIPTKLGRAYRKGLLEHLALYPGVFAHRRFRVAALGALLVALVVRVVAAPSAANVGLFAGKITHRGCAFRHLCSPSTYFGGGEIMTTLSPLTTIVPRSFDLPSSRISTESSSNRFMCWSKPCRFPLMTLPPFNLISTTFPRLSSRTLTAISTDMRYLPRVRRLNAIY